MVEVANAEQCVNELTDKGRLSGKATSVKLNVVACAIALHAGEKFASDSAAKLLFGVPRTTNVRGWVKLLAAMAEAGQAHGCQRGGGGEESQRGGGGEESQRDAGGEESQGSRMT